MAISYAGSPVPEVGTCSLLVLGLGSEMMPDGLFHVPVRRPGGPIAAHSQRGVASSTGAGRLPAAGGERCSWVSMTRAWAWALQEVTGLQCLGKSRAALLLLEVCVASQSAPYKQAWSVQWHGLCLACSGG